MKKTEAVQPSNASHSTRTQCSQGDQEIPHHHTHLLNGDSSYIRPAITMRMQAMRSNLLFLLYASPFLPATSPALYSLQDQARPGLALSVDPSASPRLLQWWEGGPAFALASSSLVRINFRGLFTYPPKTLVRQLRTIKGWHCVPCNASAFALCSADAGHVLPSAPPSPRAPQSSSVVTADGWKDLACTNSAGKQLVSLGVYDISACDVFDEGLDLAFSGGELCHRHNTTELWEYWVLVILAIVLVRFFSRNIQVPLGLNKHK